MRTTVHWEPLQTLFYPKKVCLQQALTTWRAAPSEMESTMLTKSAPTATRFPGMDDSLSKPTMSLPMGWEVSHGQSNLFDPTPSLKTLTVLPTSPKHLGRRKFGRFPPTTKISWAAFQVPKFFPSVKPMLWRLLLITTSPQTLTLQTQMETQVDLDLTPHIKWSSILKTIAAEAKWGSST